MSHTGGSVLPWVVGLLVLLMALTGGVSAQTATQTAEPTATPFDTPSEGQDLFQLWDNYHAFIAFIVIAFMAIGMWSRSLTLGAFGGYLAYLHIAFETQTELHLGIATVTLVLTFLGFAFKLVRLEFGAE